LGLGLYIAHQIAKAHGGVIAVVSTPVETRFTFRMPLSGLLDEPEGSRAEVAPIDHATG
jgi:signal transduction histidine kinase